MSGRGVPPDPPVLRCGRCGRFAAWEESRLQVICDCRPRLDLPPVLVREADGMDRKRALELFRRDFGPAVVVRGTRVPLEDAPVFVAEAENDLAGALAWRREAGVLQILALATDPMWQRAGVAGHLLAEAELLARREGLPRVTVTMTNDNIPALYFFQRRGYRLAEIIPNSAALSGPARTGFAGIPIQDELELAKLL